MDSKEYIRRNLDELTPRQADFLGKLTQCFTDKYLIIQRNTKSDIISEQVLRDFGDYLRIHHCFSKLPFTKDKFEYALEDVLRFSGRQADLAPTGNPGHDITVDGVPVSLKSQADNNIKIDTIHISKFMELGKGVWTDKVKDLEGLRNQFFAHMEAYNRIFTLRCILKRENHYHYELVEIPKHLLLESKRGLLRVVTDSKQMPKPGYCDVADPDNTLKFQLYFDGGGERKLQIKNIRKDLCVVHAEWKFNVVPL